MEMGETPEERFSATFQSLITEGQTPAAQLIELLGSRDSFRELIAGSRMPSLYEATVLGAFFRVAPSALLQSMSPSMGVSFRLGTLEGISDVSESVAHATKLLAVDRLTRDWGHEEPTVSLSNFSPSKVWHDREAGEKTASRLRAFLDIDDLDPVEDLTGLVESLGYPVEYRALPRDVHGISVPEQWGAHTAWVILINCEDNWARQRFTLAHELSHILQRDTGQVVVDRATVEDRRPERIADSFARNFLLPEDALHHAYESHGVIDRFERMAALVTNLMLTYGVSRDATMYALNETLGEFANPEIIQACGMARIADLMLVSGNVEQWLEVKQNEGNCFPSERLTQQALNSFAAGLISLQAVADVIADGDQANAAEQLHAAGWDLVDA
ncbi:ImmA/IrrE family metallo-endopeptidase [Streptomyces sp. 3214.6]|uniref:ImmA/IrrE family metallo-endopeptidase n=1 Tax=Streptomyces sp. 3214.6 TaxID=1882757 RepID=UPI00090AAE6B|nr:ImmA/IrrE family metallo-endopeptidase [Streptomyces sp. 3214.6]SHH95755.1 Zn-dependent peptidase ImmA, M78 family [Streptomyces sp. 3214.6]